MEEKTNQEREATSRKVPKMGICLAEEQLANQYVQGE